MSHENSSFLTALHGSVIFKVLPHLLTHEL
nr:MAG TPA: hypothetical protein [Bacteriophage sp.]